MAKRKRTYKKRSPASSKRRYSRKTTRRRKASSFFSLERLSPETARGVLVVALFLFGIISLLSFLDLTGVFGIFLENILKNILGWQAYIFPIFLMIVGGGIMIAQKRSADFEIKNSNYFGAFLFILCLSGFFHLFFPSDQALEIVDNYRGGGYVGFATSYPLRALMGTVGTGIIFLALIIISSILLFNISFQAIVEFLASIKRAVSVIWGKVKGKALPEENLKIGGIREAKEKRHLAKDESEDEDSEKSDDDIMSQLEVKSLEDRTNKGKKSNLKPLYASAGSGNWQPYPLDLLERKSGLPTSGDIHNNAKIVRRTLQNFGIDVDMGEVNVGPTVTQYTFKPAEGVKLSRITALNNDLALALAAHPLRIEAPIPGRALVGIEIPNQTVAIVRLREAMEGEEFAKRSSNLSMLLGRNVAGTPIVADLTKMPHLLVAGATGSGKSVCLNTILLTLLWQNSPEDLRLIIVDPKKVEMTCYNNLPHLLTPVITDVDKTVNALRWAVSEMERRFELFSEAGKRDIAAYNKAAKEDKIPYIMVVIDELADLMAVAANEVEGCIVRLAQMARAVGIHLVLATQRPSVNIITGLIKANITSRIAFAVASQIDSRTIIDSSGAEKLLGNGDMLYITSDLGKPRRIQGIYVSDKEIRKVTNHLKTQGDPEYHEEVTKKQTTSSIPGVVSGDDADDELFDDAQKIVMQAGKASASLLQRRLRIGYARAARLLDILEEKGLVGPADGAKPREIFVGEGTGEDKSTSEGFDVQEER
ncbi:MAG: DNA translocase FtsK [Parcubacteria group bacterium]